MTYSKKMQNIVMDYQASGEHWPPTKREIAAWAIKTGRWQMPPSAILGKCANDIGEVMGEIYFTDKKGRRVPPRHREATGRTIHRMG